MVGEGEPINRNKEYHRLKGSSCLLTFPFPVVPEIPCDFQRDSERSDGPSTVAFSSIYHIPFKNCLPKIKKNLEVNTENNAAVITSFI